MATMPISRTIDARGMPCPGPLMALIGAIRGATVGDVIEVLSTDAGSRADIPAWVRKAGHEVVALAADDDGALRFEVRKAR